MKFDSYGKNWDPAEHYKDVQIARKYDQERFTSLGGRLFNTLERRLIRHAFADMGRESVIVDIPCGTGRLAEELVQNGHHVVGIDIAPAMLEVATSKMTRHSGRFETVIHDARQLQHLGRTFDAALCARVLMHLPLEEQIVFLRGIASICRGRIVFTQGIDTEYQRLRRKLKAALGHQAPAVYPLTETMIGQLLDGVGLREVRRDYVFPGVSESFVLVAEKR